MVGDLTERVAEAEELLAAARASGTLADSEWNARMRKLYDACKPRVAYMTRVRLIDEVCAGLNNEGGH